MGSGITDKLLPSPSAMHVYIYKHARVFPGLRYPIIKRGVHFNETSRAAYSFALG